MTTHRFAHEFVDTIPDDLDTGVLYVSMEFRTTMHLCACGCGGHVVLPLRPTAWAMSYNGESISMSPSVGNWSFACRSHYWIRHGEVRWAEAWTDQEVDAGRTRAHQERGAASGTGRALGQAEDRRSRLLRRLRSFMRFGTRLLGR